MKPAQAWPLAIVGVLAITVAVNFWIYYEANRDPKGSFVESDYYDKAVAYDSILAQSRADSALAWRLGASFGPWAAAGTQFRLTLVDRAGRPIEGAWIRLVAISNLDAGHEIPATLVTGAGGRAVATIPLPHPGLWELRCDARRGVERFTSDLRRDLPGGAR